MTLRRLSFTLFAVLVLSGCQTADDVSQPVELTKEGGIQSPPDAAPAIPVLDACTQSGTSMDADELFSGIASPQQAARNLYMFIHTQRGLERQWTDFDLPGPAPTVDFEQRQVLLIYESYSSTPADLQLACIVENQGVVQVHFLFNVHAEEEMGAPRVLIMTIEKTNWILEYVRYEYFVWEEQTRQVISPESD